MAVKAKFKDYESALERLEEITNLLESGEVKLEDSIKLYTEGQEIAQFCDSKLSDAEKKIKLIVEKSGKFEETEFEPDGD